MCRAKPSFSEGQMRKFKFIGLVASLMLFTEMPAKALMVDLPVGYSNNLFQFDGTTSSMYINAFVQGARDPSMCAACYSSYSDAFTIKFFDQTGSLLNSSSGLNYFYLSSYSDSHGIGALPVWFSVPSGTTTFEIANQAFINGFVSTDGSALNSIDMNIDGLGAGVSATPLPAALPLFATGLSGMGLLGWWRRRKNAAAIAAA